MKIDAVAQRQFPIDERELRPRRKHDVRRFRIEANIEFRRHEMRVAAPGHRAAHDHELPHALRQRLIEPERQREIGQRRDAGNHEFARMFMRQPQHRMRGVLAFDAALRRRVAGVAETIVAVNERGIGRRQHERPRRTGEHRRRRADDLDELERVRHGVFEPDVARGDGQSDHIGMAVREQNGERIVHAGIGIDK